MTAVQTVMKVIAANRLWARCCSYVHAAFFKFMLQSLAAPKPTCFCAAHRSSTSVRRRKEGLFTRGCARQQVGARLHAASNNDGLTGLSITLGQTLHARSE